MRAETLELLSCIAPALGADGQENSDAYELQFCGGQLRVRDALTLDCVRCGLEYPLRAGVAHLLLNSSTPERYARDNILQNYYEMHFGPFISGAQLAARLSFPQPNVVRPQSDGVPIEGFEDVRRIREAASRGLGEYYAAVSVLTSHQALTEEYYAYMLELCRPMVTAETVILDAGCGMGRLTAELAGLGARLVIGLDHSPNMIEEAVRLTQADGPVPVRLNTVAGRTMAAQITLGLPHVNCEYLVGDAQQLAFRAGSFDLVLALNLVDRVPNPVAAIDELARVLKAGGHLVISDPYDWQEGPADPKSWVPNMASWFDSHNWQRVREVDGIPFVLRTRSSRRLTIYMNHCLVYQKQ